MTATTRILADLRRTVGEPALLLDPERQAPYLRERRGAYESRAMAVVRPGSTPDVAAVVKVCAQHQVGIVPVGGNTGLCGGSVAHPGQVLLSLDRMQRIRAVDTVGDTMTVEAGCILADVQAAAREAGRYFPLSLAAEGSCTLGGNLATNAGGTNVLRYGSARDLTLGIEAVLADGTILDDLRGLRKDNAGYALRHLFIGAEGTLGIITAAVLRSFPAPAARQTAWAAVAGPAGAVTAFRRVSDRLPAALSGCELISRFALELVLEHASGARDPLDARHPWYLLLEFGLDAGTRPGAPEEELFGMLEDGLLQDVAVAQNLGQARALWGLREAIPEAQRTEGASLKHDVSVPLAGMASFIEAAAGEAAGICPGIRPCVFGHLGDGNLHFNFSQPADMDGGKFLASADAINRAVYDRVSQAGGSFAAEHGIGLLKVDQLSRYRPAHARIMAAIKSTLDPQGLMNPG